MMPKPIDSLNVLTAALRLWDLGFWVVPCDGKRAVLKDWNTSRLPRDDLERRLAGTRLNIAIELSHSGLIDVECDTPEAETALQSLFEGEIPLTPTWQSNRGKHRLFRRPEGLPCKAKIEVDGVEFRLGNGKGALSCFPPSRGDSGNPRRWLRGQSIYAIPPADLPPAVVARLLEETSEFAEVADLRTGEPIPEGQRNDTLFKLACRLFAAGVSQETVETTLLAENAARCVPPLSAAEVAGIVRSASASANPQNPQKTRDLILCLGDPAKFWITPQEIAFATVPFNGHDEHWRVRSKEFGEWIARAYYKSTGKAVNSADLSDALNSFSAMARFGGETHPAFLRTAEHDSRLYLDLCDSGWRAVEIDEGGWCVVERPPVRLRRTKAMLSLPLPERGGSVDELRDFLNLRDEHWPLILGWLIAALRPTGPYPVLKLLGEMGSAKSTASRVLRSLSDPNVAPARSAPRGERDLMIAANNSWVACFDNLSNIDVDLSDAICRLATGGSFATRTLYTNEDETIFEACRPVILNGIEDVGFRSDLQDRAILVELPRIESGSRRSEREFWAAFEDARPRILGALLDAVSVALTNLPEVAASGCEWPRMADFAQWVVAAEPALGLSPGTFLAAYEHNRQTAATVSLESSPVVAVLLDLLRQKGSVRGTATQILERLTLAGADTRDRSWPRNARALSGLLMRVAPNLRQLGYVIEQDRSDNRKLWTITGLSKGAV